MCVCVFDEIVIVSMKDSFLLFFVIESVCVFCFLFFLFVFFGFGEVVSLALCTHVLFVFYSRECYPQPNIKTTLSVFKNRLTLNSATWIL